MDTDEGGGSLAQLIFPCKSVPARRRRVHLWLKNYHGWRTDGHGYASRCLLRSRLTNSQNTLCAIGVNPWSSLPPSLDLPPIPIFYEFCVFPLFVASFLAAAAKTVYIVRPVTTVRPPDG